MRPFAQLLDALIFTPARNGKLALIEDYLRRAPDPDRGYAVAALTGDLSFARAKPALIRGLVETRIDAELFGWSYDYVGDLAETVALIWPENENRGESPHLATVVERLHRAGRSEVPALLAGWLDALDSTGRWALLKLITGGLRVGVSAGLVRAVLAGFGKVEAAAIEEVWHGLTPPYRDLFAWLEGKAPMPAVTAGTGFRPMMLAHPLDEGDLATLDPQAFRAEWKWDGARVQLAAAGGAIRLYSRTGDDIGAAFPDLVAALAEGGPLDVVADGEILVARVDQAGMGHEHRLAPAPFAELQQRLNRKTVTAKMARERPAFLRLYDLLFEGVEDLRGLAFDVRRARLEAWMARDPRGRIDLSPLVPFADWTELATLRERARDDGIEGLMLKRADSVYIAGRPKGPWFKWKRGPLTVDAVLMYAQRGHGKRSSFYSDYTFGCWRPRADGEGRELVPVGKAYFGFTDAELVELDRWVRNHTTNRFGPVREVEAGLVLEVACDSVQRSTRHKSGVAMRFPRVSRIRWDKPVEEADEVATLERAIAS